MIGRVPYYYSGGDPPDVDPGYGVVPPVQITPRLSPDASPIGQAVILALVAEVGTGRIMGEINPDFRQVSWLMNDYGEAEMVFGVNDPAITSGLVKPGRRLYLQFDNGLPDWAGVLDVPIDLDGLTVSLRAYELPYLLKWRLTGRNDTGETAVGSLAERLVAETNAVQPTGIIVEQVEFANDLIEIDHHLKPIWDVFTNDIAPYAEFHIQPSLSQGVTARLIIAPVLGRDLSERVHLIQGINMQRPQIIEQGPIINEWSVAGDVGDWDTGADVVRAIAVAADDESAHRYGLRQGSAVASSNTDTILSVEAEARLAETAEPYVALTATVLNLSPGRFAEYHLGDALTVELFEEYGSNGQRLVKRVIGRQFDVGSGTCEVILQ